MTPHKYLEYELVILASFGGYEQSNFNLLTLNYLA